MLQAIYARLTAHPTVRKRLTNVPVPLRCGITVYADLRQKYWAKLARHGYHEPETERFLVEYLERGDVVFDIGAHIGMLTVIAAKVVAPGLVYAFEIDDVNFLELESTIKRNRLRNVIAEKAALSDKSGTMQFYRPADAWGSFAVGQSQDAIERLFSHQAIAYTTPAITIDEYMEVHSVSRVDLIKIDVDGPELPILKGAVRCLKQYQPALIVEAGIFNADLGISFDDVFKFLKDSGYSIYGAQRVNETVVPIRDPRNLPVDPLKHDLNLFCYKPSVHGERWRRLWFAM